jgi:hypothetical protein
MASSSDASQDDAAAPLLPAYNVSSDSEPDEMVEEQPSLWTTLALYKVTHYICLQLQSSLHIRHHHLLHMLCCQFTYLRCSLLLVHHD